MKADPKLLPTGFGANEDGELTVMGQPLTPEEEELAAVVVACHRRGWWLSPEELGFHVWEPDDEGCGPIMGVGDSPREAYAQALTGASE